MMRNKRITVFLVVFVGLCLVFLAVFSKKRAPAPEYKEISGWKEDFDFAPGKNRKGIPEGWRLNTKPGTPPSVFSVVKDDKSGLSFLEMKADKSSASLVRWVKNVDLTKTPVLRWRWRVLVLPEGADGREKAKDDQAIGIYVGDGTLLNSKCVSYRWDTETPKGDEGNCAYAGGTFKVKWYTLRNKQDAPSGEWIIDERNFAKDFKEAWGAYPRKIYLGISCNSQYTDSEAVAELDWIEFVSAEGEPRAEEGKK
ncbi:DUF3047 domain-containing protein [Candidatus Omnitrophota bacterium]